VRPPLIVLLAASTLANTCSIGSFPSLLPEIAGETALPDWQLGIFAGAFGFARMLADLPAGLFIARRLPAALIAGQIGLAAGALVVAGADTFALLFAGRALMGAGHALTMLAGLTAILHAYAGGRLSVALNAVEFSAMIGLLGGAGLVAVLPRALSWKAVLLLSCAPQVLALALLPSVISRLPRRRDPHASAAPPRPISAPSTANLAPLAFAAGAAVAIAYASVEQLVIPVRGSREFGLDRGGIARVFMLMQACDIAALIPIGILADRVGAVRVLAGVTLTMAVASVLIGFTPLAGVVAGAALFGLGMAGWMIPLSVLRRETPPALVAWRTALYRVGVDGGIFVGPFLGGLFGARHLAGVALALLVISIWLARAGRGRRAALEPVQYPP
jgi:FSR family fosmidomycin resistance protein-like MFS transporter